MHAAAISPRGGVAPKTTRLRGQSIIEYVLIAAIIGLVVVFVGPQVSGAIRKQFNQVANTVDSGAAGDNFLSPEEKAYREAMKTIAQKEAKDWTLDEQKAAATDIAKNGSSSPVYAKAKAAMDAGTTWQVKLTNGERMEYRIVGVNHDDLADGSGKAGLTFFMTYPYNKVRMNATNTNTGGWESSEIRQSLNSGDFYSLLPSEICNRIKPVKKLTDNQGGGKASTPTVTVDKVFLLSSTEIWGNLDGDGSQYEYYASRGVTTSNYSAAKIFNSYWTRSVKPDESTRFTAVYTSGAPISNRANDTYELHPAFCF